jgi:O-antigen/teichoic acid export membrane protein
MAGMRAVSFAVNIIAIAILHDHLDPVRFGLWLSLMSVWLLMAQMGDLGTGAGIVNAVAKAAGHDDARALKEITSTGLFVVLGISLLVLAIVAGMSLLVPWGRVFRIEDASIAAEFGLSVAIAGIGVALAVAGSVALSAQRGLQRGYESYFWQSGALVVALAGIYLVAPSHGTIPAVSSAFFLPLGLVAVVACIVFFGVQERAIAPSPRHFTRSRVGEIGRVGVAVFGLQIISSITFFSDPILLGVVLGPEAVAELAVPARLFNMVSLAVSVVTVPLWPAYADAIARGDIGWVRRTLRRSLVIALCISCAGSATIVLLHRPILHLWMGPEFSASLWMIVGLGMWCIVESTGNAVGMFLNASNKFRLQLWLASLLLVVSLTMRTLAAMWFGQAAVPFASVIAYLGCVLIPVLALMRRILREFSRPAQTQG